MRWKLFPMCALLAACAAEPTTPSARSLAGQWFANRSVYGLSGIRLGIVQEPEGLLSGTWAADSDGRLGECPQQLPCNASGRVVGRNTIAQVEIELLGAGKFEGSHVSTNTLRGVFVIAAGWDTVTLIRTPGP